MTPHAAGIKSRLHLRANRKGFLAILGGTAGGQAITLAAAPVLARVYDPAQMGVFTVLYSLVMLTGSVAALRFELAVPLPRRDTDAHSVAILGLVAALAVGLVGAVVVSLGRSTIAARLPIAEAGSWLWFIPVSALLVGAYLVLNQLAVRQRRFVAIGRRSALQAAVTVGSQLALGTAGLRPGGLMLGFCLGQAVGVIGLLPGSGLYRAARLRSGAVAALVAAARRYRRFPWLMAPAGLLNVAGTQVPFLLIASFYGSVVAGWLGLTQRVLWVPILLIGTAVGQVYLSVLSRARHDDPSSVHRLFATASSRLAVAGGIVALGLLMAGPPAFAFVLGDEWAQSGHFARALALSVGAQLVAAPLSQTLVVFERLVPQLALDLGRLTGLSGAVLVCHLVGASAQAAVWTLSIGSAGFYLVAWLMSRSVVRGLRAPS